jgi:broad specificity phosphatase PhoE
MVELILIRHGETEWSRTGQHTGRTDLSLTTEGRAEVESSRSLVRQLLKGRQPRIYTSPAARAKESAEIIFPGSDKTISPMIAEYDYGDFEGLTSVEIRSRVPDWDIWRDGCPNGEDTTAVGRRADAFLEAVSGSDLPIAAFSHGHMLRILAARFLCLAGQDGRIFTLDTAAVSVLKVVRGSRVIGLWNATRGVFPE